MGLVSIGSWLCGKSYVKSWCSACASLVSGPFSGYYPDSNRWMGFNCSNNTSAFHRAFPWEPLSQGHKSLGDCPHGWLGLPSPGWAGWRRVGLRRAPACFSTWVLQSLTGSLPYSAIPLISFVVASSLPQGRLPPFLSTLLPDSYSFSKWSIFTRQHVHKLSQYLS